MPCKYVVGSGLDLERALAAWRALAPALELRPLELSPRADQDAMHAALADLDQLEATAFVAADAYFLNFHRLELMSIVRGRGIQMPALAECGAIVSAGVRLLDNSWVGAGAVIGPGCRIGFNVVIGAGAVIGAGTVIGQSAYISSGVVVGHGANIGSKATLGIGVSVGHGVEIGALSVIDRPGRIDANVAAKTFIHATHSQPIVIIGQ